MPQQHPHISWMTKFRAWWAGAEHVEMYARYGERTGLWMWMMEWKGTLIAMMCIVSTLASRANNALAMEALEHSEMNRARFYKRDFVPEYVEGAPKGFYDGAVGYHYVDEATGLKVNADNKLSGPNRTEMLATMERNPPEVSPEMLRAARALRTVRVSEEGGAQ
jgi:hypothetical protein